MKLNIRIENITLDDCLTLLTKHGAIIRELDVRRRHVSSNNPPLQIPIMECTRKFFTILQSNPNLTRIEFHFEPSPDSYPKIPCDMILDELNLKLTVEFLELKTFTTLSKSFQNDLFALVPKLGKMEIMKYNYLPLQLDWKRCGLWTK